MEGSNEAKRVLLLQKKADKKDAKPEDVRKSYRALGVTACQQLQAKKASDVELLISDKVADQDDHLGIFENSLTLSNWENSHKKIPTEEEEKKASEKDDKEPEQDKDDRTKRVNKHIENIKVTTEDANIHSSESNKF